LAHIDAHCAPLALPALERLGLGNIIPLTQIAVQEAPLAQVTKLAEKSKGKDTTTGHWEMAGVVLNTPFPTYPDGFRDELVNAFIEKTGCKGILGNKAASGTKILEELGEEHLKTGYPIIYTSADSVWQIATHTDVTSIDTLYEWCEIAREILRGEDELSRVIARPFEGDAASGFKRIGYKRRDYAVPPPEVGNILVELESSGAHVIGVGKIKDIFCDVGITHSIKTTDNRHGMQVMMDLVNRKTLLPDYAVVDGVAASTDRQLIFNNLVETDMNYGHRRNVVGYGRELEAIDKELQPFLDAMTDDDLLIITGDHGCDPTAPGSDHTREYVPYISYSPSQEGKVLSLQTGFDTIGKVCQAWLDGSPLELV
ncbi:MAG TPA: phosphopentomutase, partial [Candidatus Obscuribacterales bacterium]